ncbi:MAG: hypothetical protein ACLUFV_12120 [Acutalibacteraceae bacterium]
MHGEELTVQSVYGEFCEFSFMLPLAQIKAQNFEEKFCAFRKF